MSGDIIFKKKIGRYRGGNGWRYDVEVTVYDHTVDSDFRLDTDLNPIPIGTKFQTVFVGAETIAPKCRVANGWVHAEEIAKQVPKLRELAKLHKRTHFADLKAGTKEQQAAIDAWLATGVRYDYSEACEYLKTQGLYVDRGYSYGSAWLVDVDALTGDDLVAKVTAELDKLKVKY